MFSSRALASLVLGLSLAPSAFALTYGEAKSIAKTLPKQYLDSSDHGKLCEVLGVKIMQDLRPGATVLNGVAYRKRSMTIGELDLVVMQNNVVTDVVEVKCWSSFKKAANKANEQLDRFSDYIGRCDIDFTLEGKALPCDAFGNPDINLGKMSYKDAKTAGFNFDLNFTRNEILQLIKDARSTYNVKDAASDSKTSTKVESPKTVTAPAQTPVVKEETKAANKTNGGSQRPVLVDDSPDMSDLTAWWHNVGSKQ